MKSLLTQYCQERRKLVDSMESEVKIKKVHPRIGHEGPDREQRYSSSLSLILALDWGGWSTPHPC